jgi:glycosyltransferase involved in cell wall biosynthesis
MLERTRGGLKLLVVMYVFIGSMLHAQTNIRRLAELARRGHEVVFLAATAHDYTKDGKHSTLGFRIKTVLVRKVVPVLSLTLFNLNAVWLVLQSIAILDCLIADPNSFAVFLPFLVVRRLGKGRPVLILRVNSIPVETRRRVEALVRSFHFAATIRLASVFADKILFVSPMAAKSCSREFRVPQGKVAIASSTVDMRVFSPAAASRGPSLRDELDLRGDLGVLYHGALTRGRGIMELVNAFKILRDESVRAVLILLGNGPIVEEIRKFVLAEHLDRVVQLRGSVDYVEVPNYIAACDVGILPLPNHPWWRDQCPLKMLECLAMNKPVIVSDIPATRWVIKRAPLAVYLTGTTPREIADGVRKFLAIRSDLDPSLGRQIATAFSNEKGAQSLEHEILSALRSRR